MPGADDAVDGPAEAEYQPVLFSIAYGMTGSAGDAEEYRHPRGARPPDGSYQRRTDPSTLNGAPAPPLPCWAPHYADI